MPSQNLEIYAKDPLTHTLLNQGVAKVSGGESSDELETLRYELTNFVCDGQYAKGLARILQNYLSHLGKSEQSAVWVSGFFGSGKSHLVKMLQYLWVDFQFPDGAKARGLAKLPTSVSDPLKELTTSAKQRGGLHAAGGDLRDAGTDSIRLALLSIVFKSAGLPEKYSRACFQMWLRDEGLEDGIRQFLAKSGEDFDKELTHLYVSDSLAKAILHARPDFAAKPADVKLLLKSQFPPDPKEVSTDEMVDGIKKAIGRNGKLPCTVVILDEVQQFINDPARSKAVQDVVEQCSARLGSNFLIIGTGQNALAGTPLLDRLQGRFPVPIELHDTDVDQVTREVILKKKPSAEPAIRKMLEERSGEIERQLSGSKIQFTNQDRALLVEDYPILPVRRRFWERVLRAADQAGMGAQLRTQLWVVHEAVKQTAHWPLGHVVGGAFIYEASIKSSALKSGTLLQEISETIEKQAKDGEPDGQLRYQICALIFLIGQLPQNNAPLDAGIRADADTLADLLVTDLTVNSGELRKKVPELLEKLADTGAVMRVEDEYRMQTREGSEWTQAYLKAKNALLLDVGKLPTARSERLRKHCRELVERTKLTHGASKTDRKFTLHFGEVPPQNDGPAIPIWIRDGWEVVEKSVLDDAREASDSEAVVYGFIPKKSASELDEAIAGFHAAETTLASRGKPSGDEGLHAYKAMETRRDQAERAIHTLMTDILNDTRVFLAGGDGAEGILLNLKVQDAATRCLDRLFPLFHLADHPALDWEKVFKQAVKGSSDAMNAVGHKEEADKHPVCKAILDFVGSGKRGSEVLAHFGAPRYGWPKDAIDAALAVLVQSGTLRSIDATREPLPVAKFDHKSIASTEFRSETIKLGPIQLTELRGLFKKLGLNAQPNQESIQATELLNRLTRLAESAGGDPPRPGRPDIRHVAEILGLVGNEQLKAIHDRGVELADQFAAWQASSDLIQRRLPQWNQLTALLKAATDLPIAAEVQPELVAIEAGRRLLANPDPVPGLVDKLTHALRSALNEAHGSLSALHETRLATLETSPTWNQLTPDQKHEILGKQSIRAMPEIAVGTTEEVLDTLGRIRLSQFHASIDALPTRFDNAAAAAAKVLEPKAQRVSLPGGTIKDEGDLRAWLAKAEDRIREKMVDGPVIL